MKDSKDFDVNQFVADGSPSKTTAATDDAQQSKQTVPNAMREPTAPTPSSGQTVKPRQTEPTSPSQQIAPTPPAEPSDTHAPVESPTPSINTADSRSGADSDTSRRTVKQRKSELDEYRRRYMQTPRVEDRKPVFVSRATRDRLDRIVRLLGERGMSVSGLIENIARHHLELYEPDIEYWRRM